MITGFKPENQPVVSSNHQAMDDEATDSRCHATQSKIVGKPDELNRILNLLMSEQVLCTASSVKSSSRRFCAQKSSSSGYREVSMLPGSTSTRSSRRANRRAKR